MAVLVKDFESSRGYVLLEALIGILIFSVGVLGVVGLHARTAKFSVDSRYRTEAALMADELIGQMTVADKAGLMTNYSATGAATKAWVAGRLTGQSSGLPNASLDNIAVSTGSTVAGNVANNTYLVSVTISWKVPGADSKQTYQTQALIF